MTVMMLSLAGIPMTLRLYPVSSTVMLAVGVRASVVAGCRGGCRLGDRSLLLPARGPSSLYLSAPEQLNRDAPSNWQYSAGGIVVLISRAILVPGARYLAAAAG